MNGKKILAAFMAFALLGAYYWFFEVKKKAEDEKIKAEAARFFPGFDSNKISEITIKSPKGKIFLKKSGVTWYMEKPAKYECDTGFVDSIAASFAAAIPEQKIDGIKPQDFGITGNDPSIIFREFTGKTYEVVFGTESSASHLMYAAKPGEAGVVYLIPHTLIDYCEKTIFDLRYKKILKMPEAAIDKIAVNVKGKKYTLVNSPAGWRFEPDTKEKVKTDMANNIIRTFRENVAKSMEGPEAAGKRGISASSETVDFYFGKEHAKIVFGSEDKKKYSVYAQNNQIDDILELPDFVYLNLPASRDLADKRITGFNPQMARRIEANYGDRSFIAEKQTDPKKPDKWKIKSVKISKVEEAKINGSLIASDLAWLEYSEKIQVKPEGNQEQLYGFVPGNNVIRVFDDKNAMLAEFNIGKKANKQELVFVRTNNPGVIYLTGLSGINNLNLPGMEVR